MGVGKGSGDCILEPEKFLVEFSVPQAGSVIVNKLLNILSFSVFICETG